jgi:Ribonuclease G/E
MKGSQILIEPLPGGGHAAALIIDGQLHDLLIDPPAGGVPQPEAIYRAVPSRPMKGLGGAMVDLGAGQSGFLRSRRLPAPGRPVLVQVSGWAEQGKAAPVSDRIRLKGRTAILTPGAPGHNIARSIRAPDLRRALEVLAVAAMAGAPEDLGLILRSCAADAAEPEIAREIAALRAEWDRMAAVAANGAPECLLPAPRAAETARRDWTTPHTTLREAPNALADSGVWEEAAAFAAGRIPAGGGFFTIEATRALVAVDVNTGPDLSSAAALKANLAAIRDLPRQLRLRGLGGQIVVDLAPLAKSDRRRIEAALASALRDDGIDTTLVGWTPLGHLEILRKRARGPLVGADAIIPKDI